MAVRREALTLARKSRDEVDEALAQATRALTIAWAKSWDDLEADFSRAFGDLVSNGPGDRGLSRVRVRQDERLQYAMGRVSRSLGDLMTTARTETGNVVKIAVTVGDRVQRDIIAAQLPPDHRDLVTESRAGDLAALITRASRRVSVLTRNLPNVIDRGMREAIARVAMARLKPDASQTLLRQAEASFNTGLTHALMIARTEALDAHRQAAALSQARQAEVLNGWIWLARLDRWTCPACFVMHGSTHALDEMGPDGHQNCLVAGALIEGPRAQASTARWFSGEVIDFETVEGNHLTVTPNHPVLTSEGWVAAGQLQKGHYVISRSGGQGPSLSGHPDDHQVPALIEDVVKSLGGSGSVESVSVPTAPEDFHGDGSGSDVHVVRTDGLLGDRFNAPVEQELGQQDFGFRSHDLVGLASSGHSDLGYLGLRHSANCRMSSSRVPAVLLGGSPGHGEPVSGGLVPELNSGSSQPRGDRSSGDPKAFGESVDGLSGFVSSSDLLDAYDVPSRDDLKPFAGDVIPDLVVRVARRSFEGHVYNLQTATGWYLANQIVVHNCRCQRVPKAKSWKELGINLTEPVDLIPDGRTIFQSLPRSQQLSILGPSRLDLLDRGEIEWGDLATQRQNPGWRRSYVPTPVNQLIEG